jgi:DNA-directed RNA polymerase specialized sigma24 family protein
MDLLSKYDAATEAEKRYRRLARDERAARRIYLVLLRRDGMSYRQIADLIGKPKKIVKKMINKQQTEIDRLHEGLDIDEVVRTDLERTDQPSRLPDPGAGS